MDPLQNRFFAGLSAADRSLLFPQLKSFELLLGVQLQERGEQTAHAHFPVKGLISLLAPMKDGRAVEMAMIGATGAVGLAGGLGIPRATSRAIVQVPGFAFRISTSQFIKAVRASGSLSREIFVHQDWLLGQIQQTAACNTLHTAEQRLASWLLQAQDHAGGDVIPFTQEFLSNMLGVRRTTVTEVASTLQRAGLIGYSRGRITILKRRALEGATCECYRMLHELSASFQKQGSATAPSGPHPRPRNRAASRS